MRATVRHNQACHVPPFPPTAALIPAGSLLSLRGSGEPQASIPAVPFLSFPHVSPSVIPARLKRESILDQIPKSRAEKPMRLTHIILVLLILAVTSPAFGTALHEAVVKNDIAEVKRLLAAGADVSAKTKHGYTPLHIAALMGHAASVKVLLQAGAETEVKNMWDDRTPLHYAAGGGGPASVKALLAAGADPNVPDKDGDTPLDKATRYGYDNNTEVINLLKDAGALSRSPEQGR